MNMIQRNWSDISTESISESAIRAAHQPAENFKIYVNTYVAGKSFPTKAGHAFVLYVLTGSCKTMVDGTEVSLSASQWINLKKGSYTFDAGDEQELKLVKVFSLS